jgi:hypothetical protein
VKGCCLLFIGGAGVTHLWLRLPIFWGGYLSSFAENPWYDWGLPKLPKLLIFLETFYRRSEKSFAKKIGNLGNLLKTLGMTGFCGYLSPF